MLWIISYWACYLYRENVECPYNFIIREVITYVKLNWTVAGDTINDLLLFVYRLPGAEQKRRIRLLDLKSEGYYAVGGFDWEIEERKSGSELMEAGLLFEELPEEGSMLLRVTQTY